MIPGERVCIIKDSAQNGACLGVASTAPAVTRRRELAHSKFYLQRLLQITTERTFSVLKAVPSIIQDEVARAEGLSAPSNVSSDSD